jgi:hypothetical protein
MSIYEINKRLEELDRQGFYVILSGFPTMRKKKILNDIQKEIQKLEYEKEQPQ